MLTSLQIAQRMLISARISNICRLCRSNASWLAAIAAPLPLPLHLLVASIKTPCKCSHLAFCIFNLSNCKHCSQRTLLLERSVRPKKIGLIFFGNKSRLTIAFKNDQFSGLIYDHIQWLGSFFLFLVVRRTSPTASAQILVTRQQQDNRRVRSRADYAPANE